METVDLIRVMKQVQQLKKKNRLMFSNQTQQNLGISISTAVYTAVSLQTLSKVLLSAQNGAGSSVLGYKMQRWGSAPLQHDALNTRGFLLS